MNEQRGEQRGEQRQTAPMRSGAGSGSIERPVSSSADVAVVGGGLAGLIAAARLARAGKRVALFERASTLGGRAATRKSDGYFWNLGPHALYRDGACARALADLGVTYAAGPPSAAGGFAVCADQLHTLPAGFVSLVTTGLLSASEKIEAARFLAGAGRIATGPLASTSVADWLEANVRQPAVRKLIGALLRLTSYANACDRMSAGAALEQLQLALAGNVLYVDGGWQVLVDGLRREAEACGVDVHSGVRVRRVDIDRSSECVVGVSLDDGMRVAAPAVVLAVAPETVRSVLEPDTTAAGSWAAATAALTPVRAACLDLALTRLPVPSATFALGIDEPTYLSVHSAAARLAPVGGAVVHVAKYLAPDRSSAAEEDERDLERLMDRIQPGWREVVRERRFLPSMTVTHALVTAEAGGTRGRPPVKDGRTAGLYVAGDWVGAEGMLADASAASACAAALACLDDLSTTELERRLHSSDPRAA